MNQENITLDKIEGIYDIKPPLTPELSGLENLLLLAGFIVILIPLVYFLWHLLFSNKSKIKRQIKQLSETYSKNGINTHNAVYQLCDLLRKGLKVNHISAEIVLPEKLKPYKQEWHCFADKLSLLRYTDNDAHVQDIDTLFKKSLFWLRIWP